MKKILLLSIILLISFVLNAQTEKCATMKNLEEMMKKVLVETKGVTLVSPFPRLSYQEAMARFGVDKPDMRFGLELRDVTQIVSGTEFKVFRKVVDSKGLVKGLCIPQDLTRRKHKV